MSDEFEGMVVGWMLGNLIVKVIILLCRNWRLLLHLLIVYLVYSYTMEAIHAIARLF